MPQFQLQGAQAPAFQALDDFTQAYIEAAFFTNEEQLGEEYFEAHAVEPLGEGSRYRPEVSDLAPETLAAMIADCAKFQADNAAVLDKAECTRGTGKYPKESQAGHDFWLTRNGHGCGFWDGDWSEPEASALDAACKAFGECSLYVGDDQLIYIS